MNIIEHTNRYTCTNRIYETIYEKIWKMSKEWIPTWGSPQLSWAQTISFFPPPTSLIITPSIPFNMLSVSTCSFKISCSWCHQISSEKMTALVQWDSMSALWAKSLKSPTPQLQALLLTVCRVASPISAGGRSVCESPGPQLVPGSSPLSRPSPVGLHYYTLGLHWVESTPRRDTNASLDYLSTCPKILFAIPDQAL